MQHLLKIYSHGRHVAELGRVFGLRKHTLGLQGQQLLSQLQVVLFLSFPVWVDSVNYCSELCYETYVNSDAFNLRQPNYFILTPNTLENLAASGWENNPNIYLPQLFIPEFCADACHHSNLHGAC